MATTQGRREMRRLDTWHSIRDSALTLFLEAGFESVSIDDIAAAASVSRATFFNYFATKEAVVFDPDPDEAAQMLQLWRARPTDEDSWTSVQQFMISYLRAIGERVTVTRMLIDSSPALAASGRSLGDRIRPRLVAWLAERHPAAETLDLAVLVEVAVSASLTAFRHWDPAQGLERFHALVHRSLTLITMLRPPAGRSCTAYRTSPRGSHVDA